MTEQGDIIGASATSVVFSRQDVAYLLYGYSIHLEKCRSYTLIMVVELGVWLMDPFVVCWKWGTELFVLYQEWANFCPHMNFNFAYSVILVLYNIIGFKVLKMMTTSTIFWDEMPHNLVEVHQWFGAFLAAWMASSFWRWKNMFLQNIEPLADYTVLHPRRLLLV